MYYSCNMSALPVGKENHQRSGDMNPPSQWSRWPACNLSSTCVGSHLHSLGIILKDLSGSHQVKKTNKNPKIDCTQSKSQGPFFNIINWFPSTLYPSFLRGRVKKTCMYTTCIFANFDLTCQHLDKSVLATPSQRKGDKFSPITWFIAFHDHWDHFGCFRNICGPF